MVRFSGGGGDISALPEFNTLAAMFLEYGVHQEIKTSGYKFLQGVADVIAKKRGMVEVSIDAGTRETYADFKGKDVFDVVVENLRRYRDCGPIRLKYIAARCNLGDKDIYSFLNLSKELKPESIMVTPEYGDLWTGQYDGALIAQVAKLIGLLRQTGTCVIPQTHEEITRIFPKFSLELERHVRHYSKLRNRLRPLLKRVFPL